MQNMSEWQPDNNSRLFFKGGIVLRLEKPELIQLVEDFRTLHNEGENWDFKKEWHHEKQDLLHDIICMANNLSGHDGYIIIGVDEKTDYGYCDVTQNEFRHNTQQVVDFLSSKVFAGDSRPSAYVETVQIEGYTIDVIIVRSDNNVPYYLRERYHGVCANHIYIRVGDTNTPIDKSADITQIEKLWRRRFGLDQSAIERFRIYLQTPSDWVELFDENGYYYKYSPEFRIVYDSDKRRTRREYYMLTQCDDDPSWYSGCLYYHQTPMEEILFNALDGGRLFVTTPDWKNIKLADRSSVFYRSYVIGSISWQLNKILFSKTQETMFSWNQFIDSILVFISEDERVIFEKYVVKNYDHTRLVEYSDQVPGMYDITNQREKEVLKEDFCRALLLKDMLKEFREENGTDQLPAISFPDMGTGFFCSIDLS